MSGLLPQLAPEAGAGSRNGLGGGFRRESGADSSPIPTVSSSPDGGPDSLGPSRLQLRCHGIVQGVGFRPFVHRLALELGLSGRAQNEVGTVVLELQGSRSALERLLERLPRELPLPGRLEPLQPHWLPVGGGTLGDTPGEPSGIRISASPPDPLGIGLVAPALSADLAPCPACLAELADPANRRFGYALISCCACGPRYSIATAQPFARAHTSLAAFPPCAACLQEFHDLSWQLWMGRHRAQGALSGALDGPSVRSRCRQTCRRSPGRARIHPSPDWPGRRGRSGRLHRSSGCCPRAGCHR